MGGLFAKTAAPLAVQIPQVPEPTVMPMADDAAMKKAKARSLRAQQTRSGRNSTILSTEDKLG